MRSIPAKIGEFDAKAVYSELLSFASEKPYTFEEMRQAVVILDKIEGSEKTILLEEAEHDFVLKRVEVARFVRIDRNVMAAIDALHDAEEVAVEVVVPPASAAKKGR